MALLRGSRLRFGLAGVGLLLGALASVGCSASADIPKVVVTQSDVAFDGVPRLPGVPDVTTTLETQFDHPKDATLPDSLDPELFPLSGEVKARGSMQNLSFIDSLKLTLSSRSPDAPPPRVVATYQRPPSGKAGSVLALKTDNDHDVLDYWSTKNAFYDLEISGVLPADAWAVDVVVAFSGKLSISSN
ncbi:MAG TPA: hypothetical protein VFS67_04980 [Polyangiaceae bacterium]|nr:hypothetical protein [Polyangiaceae bacterium]